LPLASTGWQQTTSSDVASRTSSRKAPLEAGQGVVTPSEVAVVLDDARLGAPIDIGVLRHERRGSAEVVRFSYSDVWLEEIPEAFPIDPELPLFGGDQFPACLASFRHVGIARRLEQMRACTCYRHGPIASAALQLQPRRNTLVG
jgi:hypothetical protein